MNIFLKTSLAIGAAILEPLPPCSTTTDIAVGFLILIHFGLNNVVLESIETYFDIVLIRFGFYYALLKNIETYFNIVSIHFGFYCVILENIEFGENPRHFFSLETIHIRIAEKFDENS